MKELLRKKKGGAAMQRTLIIATVSLVWMLNAQLSYPGGLPSQPAHLDPEQILRQLVPEVPDIKMVTPEDMEPNPQGKYRRHAFIQGDFNRDGQEDIAISAVDHPDWKARSGDSYVLIASKSKNGTWSRVFFEKIPGVRHPFLIWDEENRALLVGANYSDYNPGDILWDAKTKKYKLVEAR